MPPRTTLPGDIYMVQVIEYRKKMKHKKPAAEILDLIKKMQKDDEKLVKGRFEFTEAGGGYFEFGYRIYPGQLIQKYTLVHGETCEIPMGVVKHLNNVVKKVRKYANVEQSPDGPTKAPTTFDIESRVRFIPVEFI